ncbi:MAG: hypothetical protein ABIE07_07335, partial [Candidatus Zixiibacteriota bacterium]
MKKSFIFVAMLFWAANALAQQPDTTNIKNMLTEGVFYKSIGIWNDNTALMLLNDGEHTHISNKLNFNNNGAKSGGWLNISGSK